MLGQIALQKLLSWDIQDLYKQKRCHITAGVGTSFVKLQLVTFLAPFPGENRARNVTEVIKKGREDKMAHSNIVDSKMVLGEKIQGIQVVMFTTIDHNRHILRSRPMITQELPFDGDLWFLTHISSPVVAEAENRQVNLSYAVPEALRYVSVSGVAQLVRDQTRIEEHWRPLHALWFTGGKDDAGLALLKVTVTSAEYWDGSLKEMVQIF